MLSAAYGRATTLRRAWYASRPHRSRRLARPVVSVGNLAIGGSGKTPVVATLARLLVAAGERPAILSRGYGRRRAPEGVVVVSDGGRLLATPEQSGDEPYMLAARLRGVPVVVSPDRYLSGRLAERHLACTVHILDDGFQHVQLARDVDLVVMSGADLTEPLLPFGRLREPLAAARAADALLVTGGEDEVAAVAGGVGVQDAFRLVSRYLTPRLVHRSHGGGGPEAPAGAELSMPAGRRVVAVAGIARPSRFFAALRASGWDVVGELIFRDHHWFTARDVANVHRVAVDAGADLVITTEKDAVRLRVTTSESAPVWAFVPMEIDIEPADRFMPWLTDRLSAARRAREAA